MQHLNASTASECIVSALITERGKKETPFTFGSLQGCISLPQITEWELVGRIMPDYRSHSTSVMLEMTLKDVTFLN